MLRHPASLLCAFVAFVTTAWAERLPVRAYSTLEGLPRTKIRLVACDSRGLVWVGTSAGLSCFDGYTFTSFGPEHGLPGSGPHDLLETRAGLIWIGTSDGVCRFDPALVAERPIRLFPIVDSGPSNLVNALLEDSHGRVWVGTDSALFLVIDAAEEVTFECLDLGDRGEDGGQPRILDLIEDRSGNVWIAAAEGLAILSPDGHIEWLTHADGLPHDAAISLLQDATGVVWVFTLTGLCTVTPAPNERGWHVCQGPNLADGSPVLGVSGIIQARDGNVWLSSGRGLVAISTRGDPSEWAVRMFNRDHGLTDRILTSIAEDRDGNLWIGSETGGLMKVVRRGIATFDETDGLEDLRVSDIFEDRLGTLCVPCTIGNRVLHFFDGRRFTAIWPRFPSSITSFGWGTSQVTFQDRTGEWWAPTFEGLCRYPKVKTPAELGQVSPKAVYTVADGLTSNEVFRLYEDSRGDIWIGTSPDGRDCITRWVRSRESLQQFSTADGVPKKMPTAFMEDRAGNVWVSFYWGGIGRFRNDHFEFLEHVDGVPQSHISSMYLDSSGRLWIGTIRDGLVHVDDPGADRPVFEHVTTADGLACDEVLCITEDHWARLYLGMPVGVDRLDLRTGQVRHFTTADGLANASVGEAFTDRHGAVWFGTGQGLSRLEPGPDPPVNPSPVWIRQIRINGVPLSIPAVGTKAMDNIDIGPEQRQVEIAFSGLRLAVGDELRYQYRLEGAAARWSEPNTNRRVEFGNLSPGRYRFLVRAVHTDGTTSPDVAHVSFSIRPPIWRRWWFMLAVTIAVAATAFQVHRFRLARALELERLRTRIASDLHDDVGSSLSQVAILSELARHHVDGRNTDDAKPLLAQIAETSHEVLEAMSDVVWAINPEHDRLADLIQRTHRFANDTLTSSGIDCAFTAPESLGGLKLGVETRRQVYLICKEAITNAARHSRCSEVEAGFSLEHDRLAFHLHDNGRGFDPNLDSPGHGLASMRARATELGGTLEVTTGEGEGTTVRLRIPLSNDRG